MKNNIIGGLEDRQVKYLGSTHEGRKHDKKVCDEEGIRFPDGVEVFRDSGFQGHEVTNVTVHQPKKKPRNGSLADEDKEASRLISSIRVVIGHIISTRCSTFKSQPMTQKAKSGYLVVFPGSTPSYEQATCG